MVYQIFLHSKSNSRLISRLSTNDQIAAKKVLTRVLYNFLNTPQIKACVNYTNSLNGKQIKSKDIKDMIMKNHNDGITIKSSGLLGYLKIIIDKTHYTISILGDTNKYELDRFWSQIITYKYNLEIIGQLIEKYCKIISYIPSAGVLEFCVDGFSGSFMINISSSNIISQIFIHNENTDNHGINSNDTTIDII
jgi:hypothetical protein